jgi:hypothetical protein
MWWRKVEKLLQHPLIEFRVDHKFSGVRRAHATMRRDITFKQHLL